MKSLLPKQEEKESRDKGTNSPLKQNLYKSKNKNEVGDFTLNFTNIKKSNKIKNMNKIHFKNQKK